MNIVFAIFITLILGLFFLVFIVLPIERKINDNNLMNKVKIQNGVAWSRKCSEQAFKEFFTDKYLFDIKDLHVTDSRSFIFTDEYLLFMYFLNKNEGLPKKKYIKNSDYVKHLVNRIEDKKYYYKDVLDYEVIHKLYFNRGHGYDEKGRLVPYIWNAEIYTLHLKFLDFKFEQIYSKLSCIESILKKISFYNEIIGNTDIDFKIRHINER